MRAVSFLFFSTVIFFCCAFAVPEQKDQLSRTTPKGYTKPRAISAESSEAPSWVERANDQQEASLEALKLEPLSDSGQGKRTTVARPVRRTQRAASPAAARAARTKTRRR